MRRPSLTLLPLGLALMLGLFGLSMIVQPESSKAQENGLSLITATPDEGFELAITLSRRAVSTTQPDREVLFSLRETYATDPAMLIAVSQVVATHFQTIAEANDHWDD